MTKDDASALALVGVSLCDASGRLDAWSRALFLASLLIVLFGAPAFDVRLMAAACLACAGGEAFFACRLAFDRPVFAAWARLDEDGAMRAFDAALKHAWGKNPAADLPLSARVAGVRRLAVRQAAAFAGQIIVLVWLGICHVR
ncbi:MAG: hypothetical protein LBI59_03190 [Candidatus Accumulibacter sp.]|jgi:hypothetical protein|nr:hypothetical protein [Accumulibacter sp.]